MFVRSTCTYNQSNHLKQELKDTKLKHLQKLPCSYKLNKMFNLFDVLVMSVTIF